MSTSSVNVTLRKTYKIFPFGLMLLGSSRRSTLDMIPLTIKCYISINGFKTFLFLSTLTVQLLMLSGIYKL